MRKLVIVPAILLAIVGCVTPADSVDPASAGEDAKIGASPGDLVFTDSFSTGWTVGARFGTSVNVDAPCGNFANVADTFGTEPGPVIVRGKSGAAFLTVTLEKTTSPDLTYDVCVLDSARKVVSRESGAVPFSMTVPLDERAVVDVFIQAAEESPVSANIQIEGVLTWTPTDPRDSTTPTPE